MDRPRAVTAHLADLRPVAMVHPLVGCPALLLARRWAPLVVLRWPRLVACPPPVAATRT